MNKKTLLYFLTFLLITMGCGETEKTPSNEIQKNSEDTIVSSLNKTTVNSFQVGAGLNVEELRENIDLSMDIFSLSLQDLRLLRNAFAAQQGYCFMKADLRGFFEASSWYYKRMADRYWEEEEGQTIEPIGYAEDEQVFIDKIKAQEKQLLTQNYHQNNGVELSNLNNIVNFFQLEEIDTNLTEMLSNQGFAIVPNNNIQLFHVYEENDYQQFPSFVTTDMYMQLFHMYFGYVLKDLEENKLSKIASELCKGFHLECSDIIETSSNQEIVEIAEYVQTYYAIAYYLLTETKLAIPLEYIDSFNKEIENVNTAKDDFSSFLGYEMVPYPYSLYKTRGHYTRSETLTRYFKAMMWLQNVPYCADDNLQLQKAAFSSYLLVNGANTEGELFDLYQSLMDPITFLIGEPDNVSFKDLTEIIGNGNYADLAFISDPSRLSQFMKEVGETAKKHNKISPKESATCPDKINFLPQRYLADNEVLQELVDVKSETSKRAYPQGLDVMAAFGSQSAEDLLINELGQNKQWEEYETRLEKLKGKFENIDWDASVYNKWIEGLVAMQKTDKSYPYFMQTKQWQKKDLNAALSSWAELKHDAILYAEQPMAAECGGGGPPEPYTVGYVEPNIAYWEKVIELLTLTNDMLKKHDLLTTKMASLHTSMMENAQFLLSASQKEIKGEKLTDQEYEEIEYIGSSFEWLTIDLIDQGYLDGWENVQGPDKSVSVVADIYTANASNNPDKGILHVANGFVNDLFVVVEIEGYLYLTKGAVFSYHEFHTPMGTRLTDEEWQEMLDEHEAPPVPEWMNEIIVPINPVPSNEKIFYSSGC